MKVYRHALMAFVAGSTALMPPPRAMAAEEPIDELIIYGIRDQRESEGATGLDLSVFETPQSLSIIDAEMIDDYGLVDINSMLGMATGINVDATETDRTYYNSRGFDITSMHVDGIGIPFDELIVGDMDTAIYEKVEVIRGSNGLITGLGNPSGTVNYVRKRPTNDFEGKAELTVGRWNDKRVVADLSTPLTESGRWAARLVGVYQDRESWLDHYGNDRNVVYGIVDGQIGDSVTLARATPVRTTTAMACCGEPCRLSTRMEPRQITMSRPRPPWTGRIGTRSPRRRLSSSAGRYATGCDSSPR